MTSLDISPDITLGITTGTDIISVARIDRLARSRGSRFLDKWFTPAEIGYCLSKPFPARHLAARLAGKEAVLKALRTRWQGALPWRLIEITNDDGGVPAVRLFGPLEELAARTGVESMDVSLSHTDEYATATVVAVRSSRRASVTAVPAGAAGREDRAEVEA